MQLALSAKSKLPLIDGTLAQPNSSHPSFHAWSHANNVVITWIYNMVSKDILTSIIFSTAKEIWDVLRKRFPRKNGPQNFHIQMPLQQGTKAQAYLGRVILIQTTISLYVRKFANPSPIHKD